jgi:hypothetical protein
MATVTIIADNYPEKRYIRPLGYSLMALLGYSMINNGVHWLSDYPLGIALGYGFAKVITNRNRAAVAHVLRPGHSSMFQRLHPVVLPDFEGDNTGLRILCSF